ncbi:UPF0551 family protein [Tieghemostelium lacteum]|uniref:15-cis-phytoene synthase n=1 Tax=Tieghemostelium lacteum TaxID=361077 RepID=A0A151Z4H9_TIELA|nr:UPF0551 family protein [Tieghemostelium lacteum]|eukprot:KYQ88869.1 UPF0551 family protein [Tieghemostelium lacteum]
MKSLFNISLSSYRLYYSKSSLISNSIKNINNFRYFTTINNKPQQQQINNKPQQQQINVNPTNISNINSELLKDKSSPSSKSITIDQLADQNDYNYVFERAKICDKENYLCTLLIKDLSARRCAFAIRAFNIETVANDFTPKVEKMSKLRLSFWKDAINNFYNGKVYDQPLSRVLAQFIKEKQLSKTWFIRLLNRREKDLATIQLKDMEELEQYCDDIQTSMLLLTLEGMGIKGNHDIEHCASHLGKAVGLMILIRGTQFHISKRKIYIPVSLTTKHGINIEALYRGDRQAEKLKEAIYEMASRAKMHLDKARSFTVPQPANQAFIIAEIVDDFLENLRTIDFNIYALDSGKQSPWLLLKLYKNKLFGKF